MADRAPARRLLAATSGASLTFGQPQACPLRARSIGQPGYLRSLADSRDAPAHLRMGRLTRCAYRPSKQRVAGSNPAGRARSEGV